MWAWITSSHFEQGNHFSGVCFSSIFFLFITVAAFRVSIQKGSNVNVGCISHTKVYRINTCSWYWNKCQFWRCVWFDPSNDDDPLLCLFHRTFWTLMTRWTLMQQNIIWETRWDMSFRSSGINSAHLLIICSIQDVLVVLIILACGYRSHM